MARKARTGQPLNIRAEDWNKTLATVKRINNSANQSLNQRASSLSYGETGTILCEYVGDDPEVLPAGSVVGLSEPAILPEDNQPSFLKNPVLRCNIFDPDNDFGPRFGITTRPMKEGSVAPVIVSGVAIAIVRDASGDEETLGVEEDEFTLGDGGDIQVLWVDEEEIDTTENPWAESDWHWTVVLLGGGGGTPEFRWIRVDGGQELNAAPEVTGIKGAPIPATVPADLDPGVVDSAGVETTAPIGTFPDGVGYGTLYGSDGTVIGRRLVRLEGTTVLSGWTFYAAGNVTIDDDAIWIGSKTFMVINNA